MGGGYRYSSPIQETLAVNVEACALMCTHVPACSYWSFNTITYNCRLISHDAIDISLPPETGRLIRGQRHCNPNGKPLEPVSSKALWQMSNLISALSKPDDKWIMTKPGKYVYLLCYKTYSVFSVVLIRAQKEPYGDSRTGRVWDMHRQHDPGLWHNLVWWSVLCNHQWEGVWQWILWRQESRDGAILHSGWLAELQDPIR